MAGPEGVLIKRFHCKALYGVKESIRVLVGKGRERAKIEREREDKRTGEGGVKLPYTYKTGITYSPDI